MTEATIILANDKSQLFVKRAKVENTYWYFVISEKVWVTSSGLVIPGFEYSKLEMEDGVVEGDNAVAFRALIKLNNMRNILLNELNKNTNLFKISED